jgi:hypothetical protein
MFGNAMKTFLIAGFLAVGAVVQAAPSPAEDAQPPVQATRKARKKRPTATELGFAMDPLNMSDWKSLREQVETTEFSSLEDPKAKKPSKKSASKDDNG